MAKGKFERTKPVSYTHLASLSGGEGSIVGTVIGALIMQTLRNGGNLLGVNSFILEICIGSLIIIAVLIDKAKKK